MNNNFKIYYILYYEGTYIFVRKVKILKSLCKFMLWKYIFWVQHGESVIKDSLTPFLTDWKINILSGWFLIWEQSMVILKIILVMKKLALLMSSDCSSVGVIWKILAIIQWFLFFFFFFSLVKDKNVPPAMILKLEVFGFFLNEIHW